MGIDHTEIRRQRMADKTKPSSKHPIAAIEKRVIGSEAFSDLAPSSVVVMLLLAASQAKNMNGHMQIPESEAALRGVERKTFRRALRDLEEHGFIFKTKQGGKQQGHCNKYAFTWQPIKTIDGLDRERVQFFRDSTKPDDPAYKRWVKKTATQKCPQASAQNVPLRVIRSPKMSLTQGTKSTPKYINANTQCNTHALTGNLVAWMPAYLADLRLVGLAGKQCFQLPEGVTA